MCCNWEVQSYCLKHCACIEVLRSLEQCSVVRRFLPQWPIKRCRLFDSIYCVCHRPSSRRNWMRFFRKKQSWKLRLCKVKGWRARTVEIKVRQQQMKSAVWRSSFPITRNEMGCSTHAKSLKCWSQRRRNRPRYGWSAERSSSMPVPHGR